MEGGGGIAQGGVGEFQKSCRPLGCTQGKVLCLQSTERQGPAPGCHVATLMKPT
jgi:hypothetical protein